VNTVEVELLVLIGFVLVTGAGTIEMLKRIEKAINQNYQASLARAMTTTDIAVKPEKEKVLKPCICGHPYTMHWDPAPPGQGTNGGRCRYGADPEQSHSCECQQYRPKRGAWPGEVKV